MAAKRLAIALIIVAVMVPSACTAGNPLAGAALNAENEPFSSAVLHVQPPVGDGSGNQQNFDQTLTDFLTVAVMQHVSPACGDCGCGNGTCEPACAETCQSCAADCGSCFPECECGDGVCLSACGETCDACLEDCGECAPVCACGDGVCDPTCGEECGSCAADCGSCPPACSCGDGVCDPTCGESCSTCAADCGSCPPACSCGDGVCDPTCGEACDTCAADCGSCVSGCACGDGVCDPTCGEECGTCAADCSSCPPACSCGDGVCDPACSEECGTCAADCGSCAPACSCGDGACDPTCGEACSTCAADCGSCPLGSACGDGVCDPTGDESCSTCTADCGSCFPECMCGDGACDPACGEACNTCAADCGSCVSGCEPVTGFVATSQSGERGLDYVRLQNRVYHVNWDVPSEALNLQFDISFYVAGLEIGSITYTPSTGRTVPIRFGIDNHPRIRTRVLAAQGYSETQVAQALRDEFGLDAAGILQVLVEESEFPESPYSLVGIVAALRQIGFDAETVYQALQSLNLPGHLNNAYYMALLEQGGFTFDEIYEVLIAQAVVTFAPQFRLDSGDFGVWSQEDSYPMAAQYYYEQRTGPTPVGVLNNSDASTITNNAIPVYWKAFRCGPDGRQVRIVYWAFYGNQPMCDCCSGGHDADWEKVMVVLSQDMSRIAAVTFFQHTAFYTRYPARGGFGFYEGTHPIVYTGRNSHGSYHNTQEAFQSCCYWEDHRDGDGPWWNTWNNLVKLRTVAEGGEEWMDADLAGTFTWGEISTHPMTASSPNCGQQTCAGLPIWGCDESGCYRSQCEVSDRDDGITCWHCPPGYVDWGTFCVRDCWAYPFCSSTSIDTYGLRYTISQTDAGLLYSAP